MAKIFLNDENETVFEVLDKEPYILRGAFPDYMITRNGIMFFGQHGTFTDLENTEVYLPIKNIKYIKF